jgi:hypothetical protein
MTKLTKSVNKEDETSQNEVSSQNSFTLSQKIQKDTVQETENKQETTSISQTIATEKVTISSTSSAEEIANWLLSFIGDGVFEQLKKNPYLQLPYTEANITIKEWLEKALKTIFPLEYIQKIGEQIQQNQSKFGQIEGDVQKAMNEKTQMEEKLNKANLRFEQMQNQLDEIESEKFKIKKETQNSLPLTKLINEFFKEEGVESEEIKRIIQLLNESLQNQDENLSTFIARFSKGWLYVKSTLDQLKGEEKDKMEQTHAALTMLLKYISGIYIPERRPLLDVVAKFVSRIFEGYDFISPEQTLQIDPAIHNAGGLGNAMIKEGITFAVIRKQSRQAVKYADIKVS